MIKSAWNWVKGLFTSNEVKEVQEEEVNVKIEELEYHNHMDKKSGLSKLAGSLKKKLTGKKEEIYKPIMNREMRRFLKRMGWTTAEGKILEHRTTVPNLWSAINSLMNAKMSIPNKRKAFRKAFGA